MGIDTIREASNEDAEQSRFDPPCEKGADGGKLNFRVDELKYANNYTLQDSEKCFV